MNIKYPKTEIMIVLGSKAESDTHLTLQPHSLV